MSSVEALSTTTTSTGTVWASRLATASASKPQAFHVGMTTTGRMRQGTIRECVASSCGPRIPSGSRWRAPGSATTVSRPSSPRGSTSRWWLPGPASRIRPMCSAPPSRCGLRTIWRRMSSWRRACLSASSAASVGPARSSSSTSMRRRSSKLRRTSRKSEGIAHGRSATTRWLRPPVWRSCSGTRSSARASGSATTGWARSRRWAGCRPRCTRTIRLSTRSSPSCRSGSIRAPRAPRRG